MKRNSTVEIPEQKSFWDDMRAEQSQRSVEIQIYNNTKDISLRNARAYVDSGHCSVPPRPSVPPGSKDSCKFSSSTIPGCEGILTYESKTFTLAIFFSNPMDHTMSSPVRLDLEISQAKVHLDDLQVTFDRMAQKTSCPDVVTMSSWGTQFGCARVSTEPVQLVATMSNACSSVVKVDVEEWRQQM